MQFHPSFTLGAVSALAAVLAALALFGPGAGGEVVPGQAEGLTSDGDAISSAGPPVAVFGFGAASPSESAESLVAVHVEVTGSGFSSGDLAPLSTDGGTSGVALYRDDGASEDALDSYDTPVAVSGCVWNGGAASLLLEKGAEGVPVSVSGRFQWFVVLRAGANISDGDGVAACLRSGGVQYSDATTMPESDLPARNLTADSSPPGDWTALWPAGWVNTTLTPDVAIRVQDGLAGLEAGTAAYSYSTDGGASWSDWLPASVSGSDGSTQSETLTAGTVQFCQDSSVLNLVRFRVSDRAGNTGESGECLVRIDTTAPGGWSDFGPSGWFRFSQSPSVEVAVRDATSGLDTGAACLQYSTDGGKSWSAWTAADVSGENGSSDAQTVTGQGVPFKQDSRDLNLVRFRVADLAGNCAASSGFAVMIDTAGPEGWRGVMPGGWTTSTRCPEVSVQVDDTTSGLAEGSAAFQYSTDGGLAWSGWTGAVLTGDGRLVAPSVPFGRDSGDQNLVRFRVADAAGNIAQSRDYQIRLDTVEPGGWGALEPGGWSNGSAVPALSMRVRDDTSGLAPGMAFFRTSSDGGITWSDWAGALLGEDEGDGFRTVLATDVPFPLDSGTLNLIEFRVGDAAGNFGDSGPMPVRTDATPPGEWVGFSPSGWKITSRAPDAMVWVRDLASGLDNLSAAYQYSTDGGLTWSGWRPAVLDGPGGTMAFRSVLARSVPFTSDSGPDNLVRFRVSDLAGNAGESPAFTVQIDTEAPGGWAQISPSGWWGKSQNPTVTVSARDQTSGLDARSAQYRYSTDGGISWSDWLPATMAPGPASGPACTIGAAGVPFGQDSAGLNRIMFRAADLAGNLGSSPVFTIRIDTTPPGGWEALSPSGWCSRPGAMTVTISGRDAASGILPGQALFQCSFDGGATWGPWTQAELEGSEAGPGARTLVASNLDFDGLPPGAGRIRFRLADLAGNVGTSPDYQVLVDTAPPGGWTGPFPGGWFTLTRRPSISVQAEDLLSGLDLHRAEYRFSTDGGATWSDWRPAALSGWSGATGPQTVTATCVPFDRDSGTENLVQFRVRDIAGNAAESPAFTVRIDTRAPSCALHPLPSFVANRTIRLGFDMADAVSGPESVELWYRADGGALTLSCTGGEPGFLDFVAPADGTYELFLRARDAAGNLQPLPASPGARVVVDTVAPAIVLKAHSIGGGVVRVTGHTEPSGRLWINGRAVAPAPSGDFAVELRLPPGQANLTARAEDAAGNMATVTVGVAPGGTAPDMRPVLWAIAVPMLALLVAMALRLRRERLTARRHR